MKKKHIGALLFLLALVALIAAGVALRKRRMEHIANMPAPVAHPWALRSAVVKSGTASSGFPCLATATSAAELTITGQLQGTILKLGPREGVAVRKGDVLAEIDTSEIDAEIASVRAKLSAAQASAARLRKEAERERDLLAAGGSTQSKVDELETQAAAEEDQVTALERSIDALEVRRGYARIVAPADGVVAERMAEVGDVCMPAHPIYRLTVSQGAHVRVRLPQSVLEAVHAGTPIDLSHGTQTARLLVSRVHPALDAQAMGTAETDVEEIPFGLPSGARISARVVLQEEKDALLVPRDSLFGTSGGSAHLFLVAGEAPNETLRRIPVQRGIAEGSRVSVHGALNAGERVVRAPTAILARLRDGDAVVIEEPTK
ncbi:MAG TPA: efflux RND transporter periplasmic adaptor subunit [Planctomycetes bacterium]|nr:efflux RND transporter periplasmic adaptor subunit [Planctomycetota bacterium]